MKRLIFALAILTFQACAQAACPCAGFSFVRPSGGGTVYIFNGSGACTVAMGSPHKTVTANGAVFCDSGSAGNCGTGPVFPLTIQYPIGTTIMTITATDAANCTTNNVVMYQEYVHTLCYTNTGEFPKFAFIAASDAPTVAVAPGGVLRIIRVEPGGRICQTFTNQLDKVYVWVTKPAPGSSTTDYEVPESQYSTTTPGGTSTTPDSSEGGIGGNSPSGGQTPYGTGTTNVVATNLVNYFGSGTGTGFTNFGSASQRDINTMGEALVRSLGPTLGEIRDLERQQLQALTNLGGGTDMTGVENRLSSATNLLEQLLDTEKYATNFAAHRQVATNEANAAAGGGSSAWGSDGAVFTNLANSYASAAPTVTGSARPSMVVSVMGNSFDLDPLSITEIASFAAVMRSVLLWMLAGLYVFAFWQRGEEYFKLLPLARQSQSAGTTILGTNANSALAAGMALLATAAIGVFIAYLVNLKTSDGTIALWVASSFNAGGALSSTWQYANNFVPVNEALAALASSLVVRGTMGAAYGLACTVIRFLVG